MATHNNPEATDRDLLIRIDERTFNMEDRLEKGTKVMEAHEIRLQAIEKLVPTLMPQQTCTGIHKSITANYTKLLIALLVATLGIIAALIKYHI